RIWRKGGLIWRCSMPERRCRMCVRASSRPTRFPPSAVLRQRRTFRLLRRRDFLVWMQLFGSASLCRQERVTTSSPSSTLQPWRLCPSKAGGGEAWLFVAGNFRLKPCPPRRNTGGCFFFHELTHVPRGGSR